MADAMQVLRRYSRYQLPTVEGVFTASASGEPMESRQEAELLEGRGVAGDRYAKLTGAYSLWKWSARDPGGREKGRQLTIVSADGVEEALRRAGIEQHASLSALRRNVVVRGMSAEALMDAQGSELTLGECRVFVHRHCVPCFYNERLCERPGQLEAIWEASGVSCEVIRGGRLRVGDTVGVVPGSFQPAKRDIGTMPPGYYVRPSLRTAEMVAGAREQLLKAKAALERSDPEGVARVAKAYGSVGLGFWPAAAETCGGGVAVASGGAAAAGSWCSHLATLFVGAALGAVVVAVVLRAQAGV